MNFAGPATAGPRVLAASPSLLAVLCFVVSTAAQAQTIHEQFLDRTDGPPVSYAISVPRAYHGDPVPLILALHYGGDPRGAGRDMLRILIQPALGELGAIIVAPDSLDGQWSTDTNEKAVNALLAEIEKKYAIDRKRVAVTGFSMGGAGTWYWADKYPDRFSAAIPVSGRPTPSADTWRVPVFAVHSRADQTMPIAATEKRIAELKQRGMNAQLVVLNGIQHYETGRFVDGLKQAVPWLREIWKAK
jgi:predicted peptidase